MRSVPFLHVVSVGFENMFIDKKNFLMCGSCFWCVSCMTENRTIVPCPSCGNNEMQSMRISDYESYKSRS